MTGPGGTLSSPNHPDTYEHNLDCEWVIRATQSERVRLTFTALSLETSRNCGYDFVEVMFICHHLLVVDTFNMANACSLIIGTRRQHTAKPTDWPLLQPQCALACSFARKPTFRTLQV